MNPGFAGHSAVEVLGKRVDFDKFKFSKGEKGGWKNTW